MVRGADSREHLRADERVRDDDAPLLAVVGAEAQGEHAVDLPAGQSPQGGLGGGVAVRGEAELGVLFTGLREAQEVQQGAGQRPGLRVRVAEGQEIVPVADPDRAVLGDPGLFLGAEKAVDGAALVELFRQLLVEIAVVLEDAVHGNVQILLEIGAVFVDAEVGVGEADLAHRHHIGGVAVGVQGHERVELAVCEHFQQHRRFLRGFHDLRGDVVAVRPGDEELLLNAVLVDADPLAVQGGEIVRADLGIVRRDEDVVALRAHGLGGIEDLLRALLGIGHVAEQVDLPGDQLFQQLRPAALDVLVFPPGVGGDALLVLVAVARAPPERVRPVEGRLIPADAHGLGLRLLRGCAERQREAQHDHEAQRECQDPFRARREQWGTHR